MICITRTSTHSAALLVSERLGTGNGSARTRRAATCRLAAPRGETIALADIGFGAAALRPARLNEFAQSDVDRQNLADNRCTYRQPAQFGACATCRRRRVAVGAYHFDAADRFGIVDLAQQRELTRRAVARRLGFANRRARFADRGLGFAQPRAHGAVVDRKQQVAFGDIGAGLDIQCHHQTRQRSADIDDLARRLDNPGPDHPRAVAQRAGWPRSTTAE